MDTVNPGKTWLLLAPSLALAVLAAHFYRAGAWAGVAAALLALGMMLVLRRRWVPALLQLCLLAATLEWLWTAWMLAQQRMALGAPWKRMVLILSVVALLTAASALVFRNLRLRARYGHT